MKTIKMNELKANYSVSHELEIAIKEAHKQGFNIYVSYLNRLDKDITYFCTEYNGLWGCVEVKYFGGYSVDMPIKPSKECGSQMFITYNYNDNNLSGVNFETMKNALPKLKNEYNTNFVVGTHKNYNNLLFADSRVLVIFEGDN